MNVEKIREDFPSLQQKINGKPIVYLDSACMTLKPRQVIEAMNEYYEKFPGCGGRSSHRFGKMVTDRCGEARKTIAKFLGAKKSEEVVFTRNTTEGLNLVMHSLGLKSGDIILTTDKEHNSCLLPVQMLVERKGVKHEIVYSNPDNTFNFEEFEKKMSRNVKLVAMVHTSNINGYTIPAKEVIKTAHDFGALVLLDAAQSVPHSEIDVRKLDVDFLAFSGHKMLGPSGTGCLYGKYHLLEKLDTFMVGGDTVKNTTYTTHEFLPPPEKFEAGLQNYSGIIGLGAAAKYLEKVGLGNIQKHEEKLNEFVTNELLKIENLAIIGPESHKLRAGVTSFNIQGMHIHDVALMLDNMANVMIRSGQYCVHSWFNAKGMEGSDRVSLYLYNTKEDAETFVQTLKSLLKLT
jgi:cysteine desulfurase/selenocysteine lyase